MSTILNALKKAKTDRDNAGDPPKDTAHAKGPEPPAETASGKPHPKYGKNPQTSNPGAGSAPNAAPNSARAANSAPSGARKENQGPSREGVVAGGAAVFPPASGDPHSSHHSNSSHPSHPSHAAPPARSSSGPWTLAIVGLLAALLGGCIIFIILSGRSGRENDRASGGTQTASASMGAAGSANSDASMSDRSDKSDRSDSSDVSADSSETREVAMGGKSLVKVQPSSNTGSGSTGGNSPPGSIGSIPPDQISQRSLENYLEGSSGSGATTGASIPLPTPSGKDSSDRAARTPDPVDTAPPTLTPVPTPSSTPRPTPSIPPEPTLFPDGSRVMAADLGLRVEGIMWDEAAPTAIINDRIVTNGDTVNGVKILKINKGDILVEWKGRKLTTQY